MEKYRDDRSTEKEDTPHHDRCTEERQRQDYDHLWIIADFKENGEDISSCKCGPDYIDPMFHRQVLGVPSRNLDTFLPEKRAPISCF